jgi:hypothetical protein
MAKKKSKNGNAEITNSNVGPKTGLNCDSFSFTSSIKWEDNSTTVQLRIKSGNDSYYRLLDMDFTDQRNQAISFLKAILNKDLKTGWKFDVAWTNDGDGFYWKIIRVYNDAN